MATFDISSIRFHSWANGRCAYCGNPRDGALFFCARCRASLSREDARDIMEEIARRYDQSPKPAPPPVKLDLDAWKEGLCPLCHKERVTYPYTCLNCWIPLTSNAKQRIGEILQAELDAATPKPKYQDGIVRLASPHQIVGTDDYNALTKAANRLLLHVCRMQITDIPTAEQREHLACIHELGEALAKVRGRTWR